MCERRRWRTELAEAGQRQATAQADDDRAAQPKRDALDTELAQAEQRLAELQDLDAFRSEWSRAHPDATVRLGQIDDQLDRLNASDRLTQRLIREVGQAIEPPSPPPQPIPDIDLSIDLGL